MRRYVFWLALAGCQGVCGKHGAVDAGPPTSASTTADASRGPEDTIESLLPTELVDVPPYGNDDKRAVCGKTPRGTCDILQTQRAGTDALGRELSVVTVRTSTNDDPDDRIEVRDHWVIGRKDGNIVFRAPIVSEMAETSTPVGDSLKVTPNQIVLDVADVAPSSWNWIGSFFPIVSLNRRDASPAHGLGTCAGDVDGTPRHGYAVQGAADRPSGWFRVGRWGDSIFVEVHDDTFTDGDHLELRLGRSVNGMACDFDDVVTEKITIDGAGGTSQKTISAKRLRADANVRTFEIVAQNPKAFDALVGVALDMVDDDGATVRRLSTAPLGPELGAFVSIAGVSCVPGGDGPVAVPLVLTDDSPVATNAGERIVSVVRAWNDATNAHDAKKLATLYADEVELYGTKMSRAKATAVKDAAFATHDHDTISDLYVTERRATFRKASRSKSGKTIWVDGYIEVDASSKIESEGDTTTDENLARKRQRGCVTAIEALLASTPEGANAAKSPKRSIDDDRPRWTVRYFTPRGDASDELQQTVAFEIDAAAGTLLSDGKPLGSAPDLTKVVAACK